MNPFLDNGDSEQANPFDGSEMNPDVYDGLNQIVEELNGIGKGFNTNLRRGIKGVKSRLDRTMLPIDPYCKIDEVTGEYTCEIPSEKPCPPGWIFTSSGNCIPSAQPCQPGYYYDPFHQTCLPTCPIGLVFDTSLGICVVPKPPNECPSGFHYDNTLSTCVPDIPADYCPPGYTWDKTVNKCIPISTITCPPSNINLTCPPPKPPIVNVNNPPCPNPIVNVTVNPDVQLPPINITLSDKPLKVEINDVTCPTPIINITNEIKLPEDETEKAAGTCEAACEKIQDETEKKECLSELCSKEPNWLRYLTKKNGSKAVSDFADKMGYKNPFGTSDKLFDEINMVSEGLKAIMFSPYPEEI